MNRGSITIWALGLCLLLFAAGFLSLDLWSGFAARQDAAAVADAAAIAGATGLDESAWRTTGTLALDPTLATERAQTTARAHPVWNPAMDLTVTATASTVTVTVTRDIPFRFIAALLPGRVTRISVTAHAQPSTGS